MKTSIKLFLFITLFLMFAVDSVAANPYYYRETASVVEMEVLDYPFMHDIAKLIKQTDHEKIFPQYKRATYKKYWFLIDFDEDVGPGDKTFQVDGSYSICVSSVGIPLPYFFEVDGVILYTNDTFIPYFKSCKIEKIDTEFVDDFDLCGSFWFFEVKDGKLIDAVYVYEPVDNGFDEYPVYDLIHKKYIIYKDWKSQLHGNKKQDSSL